MQSPNQHAIFNLELSLTKDHQGKSVTWHRCPKSGSDEGGGFSTSNEPFKLYLVSKNISLNILQLETLAFYIVPNV